MHVFGILLRVTEKQNVNGIIKKIYYQNRKEIWYNQSKIIYERDK